MVAEENKAQSTDVEGADIQSTDDQHIDTQGTDLQSTGVQSTLDQGDQGTAALNIDIAGPSTRTFDDEAGPTNQQDEMKEHTGSDEIKEYTASDDETIAEIMVNMSRPRGISIPGVEQTQVPQASSVSEELDPKDKGKGIIKESKKKKKKFTLAQLRAFEVARNEEAAIKHQAELDAGYLRESRMPVVEIRRPLSKAQERNSMISFLRGRGYKNLQRLRYPEVKELYTSVLESIKRELDSFVPMDSEREKKLEDIMKEQAERRKLKRKRETQDDQLSKRLKMLKADTVDELRNYLRVMDFENLKMLGS